MNPQDIEFGDSFNIAEHYRQDMMDSAGPVILAAIAGRTERIRLGSAVTVLCTQDPVRIYNQFATLGAVSSGRAQLIVGRGSLAESFPLFGYNLSDYEELRGETRSPDPPAAGPAGDLVRQVPLAARPPVPEPSAPGRAPVHPGGPAHLGGRGGKPTVGDPRRPLRPPPNAGAPCQRVNPQASWSLSGCPQDPRAAVIRQLGLSWFDLGYATGRLPHEQKMATIELYGRKVIPRVRTLLAATDDAAASDQGRTPPPPCMPRSMSWPGRSTGASWPRTWGSTAPTSTPPPPERRPPRPGRPDRPLTRQAVPGCSPEKLDYSPKSRLVQTTRLVMLVGQLCVRCLLRRGPRAFLPRRHGGPGAGAGSLREGGLRPLHGSRGLLVLRPGDHAARYLGRDNGRRARRNARHQPRPGSWRKP